MADLDITKHLNDIGEPPQSRRVRLLSFFSAAIAVAQQDSILECLRFFKGSDFDHQAVYETILQSYLFLGFPRMIEAAIYHSEVYGPPPAGNNKAIKSISSEESEKWFKEGMSLCKQVYGRNYDKLEKRFVEISPDMFRWMVIEGYGKVLSRPGLNSIERELAEVAALIVDRRERQLLSHILGSLNVGADIELIRQVNCDIMPLAGKAAYEAADKIITDVKKKR